MHKCETRTCEWPECMNEARGDRLCHAHRKRLQRGGVMSAPWRAHGQEPFERLAEAALAYAEAEEDEDFDKARSRMGHAAVAYAVAIGYRKAEAEQAQSHRPAARRRVRTAIAQLDFLEAK